MKHHLQITRRRLTMTRKIPAWLVAILLVAASTSTATASRLITGAQIKNGTITLKDLSPAAREALRGQTGARGPEGPMGAPGSAGTQGAAGAQDTPGASGAGAAPMSYLTGPFTPNPSGPNAGQLTIAPTADTSPAGVAQLSLIPNDPDPGNGQSRTAMIAFHPERDHIEDATIKAHRHPGDGAPGHIQIHTKNAAGTNLISRFEIQYGVDDAQMLVTSSHLAFDNNAWIAPRNAGQSIRFRNAANTRTNLEIEDSGILSINGEAGVVGDGYLLIRVNGHLKKVALTDA